MGMDDFLALQDIPIGSIWVAADGGSYGHIVVGKRPEVGDVIVKPFDSRGWYEGRSDDRIDWFKLQYRYYMVHTGSESCTTRSSAT